MKVWYEDGSAAVTLEDVGRVERGQKVEVGKEISKDRARKLVAQGWKSDGDLGESATKAPTLKELRAKAKEIGLSVAGKKKADFAAAIAAHEAAANEPDPETTASAEAAEADATTPEPGQSKGDE